jgi:gamma-glutamylputrescine oxidase
VPTTTPFWLDEPYQPRPPLTGDLTCDVAIVGGGVGGLSTAWHLAERGLQAVVLEARTAGSGASGRNGGFLIAGPALFHNDARSLVGPELARRLYQATYDAQTRVLEIAEELGVSGAFRQVGSLRLAWDEEEADHIRDQVRALQEDGFPADLVEEADLPEPLRRPGRAGCFVNHDFGMQPAHWMRGLARGLEARGVRIFEHSRVEGPVEPGEPLNIAGGGTVTAERVVVASDGALPDLVPQFRGRVLTRRLHMLATEPVGPGYDVEPLIYSRWGFEYHQLRPDRRITLGGFSDLDAKDSYTSVEEGNPTVHERLERYLQEELGVDAAVTHRWVGIVGYSADQRAFAGEAPGSDGRLFVAGGYSGSGNLNGFASGRIVAELVADGHSPDADLYDTSRPRAEVVRPHYGTV